MIIINEHERIQQTIKRKTVDKHCIDDIHIRLF